MKGKGCTGYCQLETIDIFTLNKSSLREATRPRSGEDIELIRMLLNTLIQYFLFGACAFIDLLHDQKHTTIETHVYKASVTFLLASAYLLFVLVFYYMYSYITHRNASFNPDFDILEGMEDEKSGTGSGERQYQHIIDELREMDPDVDFGFAEEYNESRVRKMNQYQKQLSSIMSKMSNKAVGRRHEADTEEDHGGWSETASYPETRDFQDHTNNPEASVGPDVRQEPVLEARSQDGEALHQNKPVNRSTANRDRDSSRNSNDTVEMYDVASVSEQPQQPLLSRSTRPGSRACSRAGLRTCGAETESVCDTRSVKSSMQIVPKRWFINKKEPDSFMDDINFYVSVYGYGFVIFVLYYAVDMTILTPSLAILCGLTVISVRDMCTLYMTPDVVDENQFVSKSISMISFILQMLALIEMFFTLAHVRDENLITSSPSYIALTFIFPCVACALMYVMPRSCSAGRHIRRAFPTAVLIAVFMVLWVKTIDVLLAHKSGEFQQGFTQTLSAMFDVPSDGSGPSDSLGLSDGTNMWGVPDTVEGAGAAVGDTYQDGLMDREEEYVLQNEGVVIKEIMKPVSRNLPLVSIAIEPLLRLALAFTVITGTVNHKTIEITAAMAFIVSYKQMKLQENILAEEHIYRAFVIAGCSLLFSLLRYVRVVRRFVFKM